MSRSKKCSTDKTKYSNLTQSVLTIRVGFQLTGRMRSPRWGDGSIRTDSLHNELGNAYARTDHESRESQPLQLSVEPIAPFVSGPINAQKTCQLGLSRGRGNTGKCRLLKSRQLEKVSTFRRVFNSCRPFRHYNTVSIANSGVAEILGPSYLLTDPYLRTSSSVMSLTRRQGRGRRGRKSTNGDDGRGAHPEGALRVVLLEPDADLEPVGQAHPVQRLPHFWQHAHRGALVRLIGQAYWPSRSPARRHGSVGPDS